MKVKRETSFDGVERIFQRPKSTLKKRKENASVDNTIESHQKISNKGKTKIRNLLIQTNFDTKPQIKAFTPKTTTMDKNRSFRGIIYPLSCKNKRRSPKRQKFSFFTNMTSKPLAIEKSSFNVSNQQNAFSCKNQLAKNSKFYFASNKSEKRVKKPKYNASKFDVKKLYKTKLKTNFSSSIRFMVNKENSHKTGKNNYKIKSNDNLTKKHKDSEKKRLKGLKRQSKDSSTNNIFAIHYFNMIDDLLELKNAIDNQNPIDYDDFKEKLIEMNFKTYEDLFKANKNLTILKSIKHEYLALFVIYQLDRDSLISLDVISPILENRLLIAFQLCQDKILDLNHQQKLFNLFNEHFSELDIRNVKNLSNNVSYNNEITKSNINLLKNDLSEQNQETIEMILKNLNTMNLSDLIDLCLEIFKNSKNKEEEKEYESNIYQHLKPRKPNFVVQPYTTKIALPPKQSSKEYSLVLDLDETLIHCKRKNNKGRILLRPYVKEFLEDMAEIFEIIIFTAADKIYADWVLDRLDLKNTISHRLYRCSTSVKNGMLVKDLSILGRDLSKLLIVDNKSQNFVLQPENGIEILSWYEDPMDNALRELSVFLQQIANRNGLDLRTVLKSCVN